MSLMAGFDMVIEISNDTILQLVESTLKIGGNAIRPPFDLEIPFNNLLSGVAHLVITSVALDLNADDTITLTLAFDRGSVIGQVSPQIKVCPLSGSLVITTGRIALVSADGTSVAIALDLTNPVVALQFSSNSQSAIALDLAGTGISAQGFTAVATEIIAGFLRLPAPVTMPLAFSVIPGANGSLTPSLVFERLEVHCIPNPARKLQALAFFGILLNANNGNGSHALKTSTAITAASGGLAVSMSPEIFHAFLFCPGIAAALGVAGSALPTSCGGGSGVDVQGVTLTSIADIFSAGHIDLIGSARKSGFCYSGLATFHAALTFSVAAGAAVPNIALDEPNVEIDVPFYCTLATLVFGGLSGISIGAILGVIAGAIAPALASQALHQALDSGLPSLPPGTLPAGVLTAVVITPEGLTLQAFVPLAAGVPSVSETLLLTGSVVTTDSFVLSNGVAHLKVWCLPDAKDYPYTEYAQQQQGTYLVSGVLVDAPLAPHLFLSAGAFKAPLSQKSGAIVIPNLETHYPVPVANGGAYFSQNVHVAYQVDGAVVRLRNIPSEGSYTFTLNAQAADCAGMEILGGNGQILTASVDVFFEGDHVGIGGSYSADIEGCGELLDVWLRRKFKDDPMVWKNVPKWVPADHPEPEQLIVYVRDLLALGIPELEANLLAIKIAHGNSMVQALLSPAARQPGLLTSAAGPG